VVRYSGWVSFGARDAGLSTLDLVVAGIADRVNNTLAIVLLNVEYLDDMIDELAEAAGRPRANADAVVTEVIAAIMRIRDIVRDLHALTGEDAGDAGEIVATLLRLIRADLNQHTEVVERVQRPALTRMPRRQLAAVAALTLGEVQRALVGTRGTLTAQVRVDSDVAISLVSSITDGEHRLDGERGSWRAVQALCADGAGHLLIDPGDAGFTVELRLPAPR
jgi:hypothetical protein